MLDYVDTTIWSVIQARAEEAGDLPLEFGARRLALHWRDLIDIELPEDASGDSFTGGTVRIGSVGVLSVGTST